MIPFFRKIRKQLANDNKPLKYMRYAIGEIVLVVIGIMIALQINTWNTNRLNRQKEAFYLNRITYELKADIQYYKELRDNFNNRAIGLDRIIEIWKSDQPVIIDTIQYLLDYTYSAGEDPWYLEPVTWTQLQQTGDLDLIRDRELADELFIYYGNVKKIADNYLLNPNTVFTKARALSNLPLANDGGSYAVYQFIAQKEGSYEEHKQSDSKVIFSVKNIIDNIWEKREELLQIFVQSNAVCKFQKDKFQTIIDKGELVLKQLEAAQANTSENEPSKFK
jgi:hypothetical protein